VEESNGCAKPELGDTQKLHDIVFYSFISITGETERDQSETKAGLRISHFLLFDQLEGGISANAQMPEKSSDHWPVFYHLIDF
tara:strand:- start:374 stop:622 length:249 start_codon:yes stop_codon:yes gene_type:complete